MYYNVAVDLFYMKNRTSWKIGSVVHQISWMKKAKDKAILLFIVIHW